MKIMLIHMGICKRKSLSRKFEIYSTIVGEDMQFLYGFGKIKGFISGPVVD